MDSTLNDDDVKEALSLIESAKLPHPSGPLLSSFIIEALNPRSAAQYVLQVFKRGRSQDTSLLQLVSDWSYVVESISKHASAPPAPDAVTRATIARRDGGKCCITGKVGRPWDPLIVAPVLPVPSRWIDGELVRKSAAKAFAEGLLKLDRIQPSMNEVSCGQFLIEALVYFPLADARRYYEVKHVPIGTPCSIDFDGSYPLLGDHSRMNIEKVDPRFIGTQARLSSSFRWFEIAKQISPSMEAGADLSRDRRNKSSAIPQHGHRALFSFSGLMKTACLAIWLIAPDRARVATYKILRKIGYRVYGRANAHEPVQRLPFGLYLKFSGDPDGFRNEFNALKMVRQYTSVPVPQPLDLVILPTESDDPFYSHDAYLLTSRVPGIPLSRCHDMLSDRDGVEFDTQMQEYLAQIRAIPKDISPENAICNILGGPCRDPRISDSNPVGPFVDETSFNQVLRNSDDPSRKGHNIVFTHADLNPRNILADRITRTDGTRGWTVTGIVDWENSGYYPEYWDYTKAFFEGFRCNQRWRDFMHEIFRPFGDFSKEFEVEKRSWEEGDYI